MKNYILYVSGGDYAALEYDNTHSEADMIGEIRERLAANEGESYITWSEENTEGEEFELELHIFDDIDPGFISFTRDLQDYDASKHRDFWHFTVEQIFPPPS